MEKNSHPEQEKALSVYLWHVKEEAVFDEIYIETNSMEIAEYDQNMKFHVLERKPELV